jgi:hypothetical protein
MAKVTCFALAPNEIEALRQAIGTEPAARAAKRLGVDRHTLLRAAAGYAVRAGSRCQLKLTLEALAILRRDAAALQEPRR